ncbi:hypothetical protein MIMGU_mgv1a021786mg, partial [Erythranthe guttata]
AATTTTSVENTTTTCFFVDCNNSGAEFTHAVAGEVCVSDILERKYRPEIVSSFFSLDGVANCEGISKPLLGVQVTELVDGFFISCTANHAVIDGTSFWHFINSCLGFLAMVVILINIPLPPLEQILLQRNHVMPSPPLLHRVFHFSKESVAKLKAKANSEAGRDEIVISSLQAVCAHLWRSIARNNIRNNCRTQIRSLEEGCSISLLIGARARIPLADGYFGNGAYIAKTSISETELLQNGLGYAGLKINANVLITSSPRHNVYGSDFGWGKPLAVRSGKGKITTFPAAEGGGIDVEACLAPETMHAMEDDAEFLEAFII